MLRCFGAITLAVLVAGCGGSNGVSADIPQDKGDVDVADVVPVDIPDVDRIDPGISDEGSDDSAKADIGKDDGVKPDIPGDLPPDVKTDVPCVPDCRDRFCGSDGCNDYCGFCEQGYLCTVGGTCEIFCQTDCTDKVCGADGCNGDCPPGCAANEECSTSFTCVLKSCEPKCDGRVCGPDSCGDECGKCGDGMFCTPEGQCTVDTNCYLVTAEGRCVGNERQWCEAGVLKKETCDTVGGMICAYDNTAKVFLCRMPEVCQPRCTGKECGPDGCVGGTCGTCDPATQVCSTGGRCGEPCPVDFPLTGLCIDDFTLARCHQGILLTYDCYAAQVNCRWDAEQKLYNCF